MNKKNNLTLIERFIASGLWKWFMAGSFAYFIGVLLSAGTLSYLTAGIAVAGFAWLLS
jgi:hypothetical protein